MNTTSQHHSSHRPDPSHLDPLESQPTPELSGTATLSHIASRSQTVSPSAMEAPKAIARYQLAGELGRGGMGVVYRAEDPQLGRPVAIKVILFPPQATDDTRGQLERRFEREARAAASIRHPSLVTVHDFGRDGDYLYLVMELVAGESLAERLKTGWLPERAAAFEIVAQVADGLAAAHAAGVVHRDVTPRNILMARDGRVVVTDFGIARSLGEETQELTRTGMLVGSPSFMAPEQVRNKEFDERVDIFSLGVVLYLLLTGKLPFRAHDLTSLLYQIVHEDPFEDAEVRTSLGPRTVRFLGRCLAKKSTDRVRRASHCAREARRLKSASAAELEATVALGALSRGHAGRETPRRAGRAVLALALIAAVCIGSWALSGNYLGTGVAGDSGRLIPAAAAAREPATTARASRLDPSPADDAVTAVPTNEAPIATDEGGSRGSETGPRAPALRQSAPNREPAALAAAAEESRRNDARSRPAIETTSALEKAQARAAEPPPVMDIVPPVLDIDDMPKELTAAEVVIAGRVMDKGSEVVLTVDGGRVPIGAGGEFTSRRPLSPGRNSLAFVAVDGAGNRTMKSIIVSAPVSSPPVASGPAAGDSAAAGPMPAGLPHPPTDQARTFARSRLADRGDGTLIDTLTGNLWSKRGEPGLAWKASKSYCKRLDLGRHRDWALPSIDELEELYWAGAGFVSFPRGVFWSSSKNGSGKAWAFDLTQAQRSGRPAAGAEGVDIKTFCLRRARLWHNRPFQDPVATADSRFPGGGLGGGQPSPTVGGGGGDGGGGGGGGIQNTASPSTGGGGGHGGGSHGGGGGHGDGHGGGRGGGG